MDMKKKNTNYEILSKQMSLETRANIFWPIEQSLIIHIFVMLLEKLEIHMYIHMVAVHLCMMVPAQRMIMNTLRFIFPILELPHNSSDRNSHRQFLRYFKEYILQRTSVVNPLVDIITNIWVFACVIPSFNRFDKVD